MLAPRLCPEHVGLEDLQIDEARDDRDGGEHDDRRHHEYAGSDRALIHDDRRPLHALMGSTPDQRDTG